jgi:hypothetical protein
VQDIRRLLLFLSLSAVFISSGCSRKSASDVLGQLTPFTHARDQAVMNTAAGKTSLDPASLSQLNICYTDLRSKAGVYVNHIAGIVQTASFDSAQNNSDEHALEVSIASYNDCLLKLQKASGSATAAPLLSVLDTNWVPVFGMAVQNYWVRDGALVQALSPDAKSQLIDQIKSRTAWPDFATIGGSTPAQSRP